MSLAGRLYTSGLIMWTIMNESGIHMNFTVRTLPLPLLYREGEKFCKHGVRKGILIKSHS